LKLLAAGIRILSQPPRLKAVLTDMILIPQGIYT